MGADCAAVTLCPHSAAMCRLLELQMGADCAAVTLCPHSAAMCRLLELHGQGGSGCQSYVDREVAAVRAT